MLAGCGKAKVSLAKGRSWPLMGYGVINQRSIGKETDLFARAFMFDSKGSVVAFVHLEACIFPHHLKQAIINSFNLQSKKIKLDFHNIICAAQHTHSAPGGFSHYPFFNITSEGFHKDIFDAYKQSCCEALLKAELDMEPCSISLLAGEIAAEKDVAFNRSLKAYNKNKDVAKYDEWHTHLALDRMMKQILIKNSSGIIKGVMNWFGVQSNSIGPQNRKIHSDNKGYASSLLENDSSNERNVVAGFFQEACADVSPNYHGKAKWWPRGRYSDEIKSAYFNGFIQFEKAKELIEDDSCHILLPDLVEAHLKWADLSDIVCNKSFAGHEGCQTGKAAIGIGFLEGDEVDSPGIDGFSSAFIRFWAGWKSFLSMIPLINSPKKRLEQRQLIEAHKQKRIIIEPQAKRILHYSDPGKIPFISVFEQTIGEIRRQYELDALNENTWIPNKLPAQLIRLGSVLFVGLPAEITVTASKRMKEALLKQLAHKDILDVIITSYSNDYSGCITTSEEYAEQNLQGAMTLFGENTLAAWQTLLQDLAENIGSTKREPIDTTHFPPDFSEKELERRSYKRV